MCRDPQIIVGVHSVADDICVGQFFFRSCRADPHRVSSCACSVWNDTENDSEDTYNREVKRSIVDQCRFR